MNSAIIEEEKTVGKLSIILVFTVFFIKVTIGFITDSLLFFTELSDSLIDFIAVIITYFALKESRKEADFQHMFGHYKINSFAGLLQGFLIIGLYLLIIVKSVQKLILGPLEPPKNSIYAVISLMIILGFVFVISQKILKIGKKHQNALIIAQGINFRSDFYRNIVVIVGLVMVAVFNITLIDIILAMIFSIKSIYDALKIIKQCFYELTDANAIPREKIERLMEQIENLNKIKKLDSVKIRTTGKFLDALIILTLKIEDSMLNVDIVSQKIRRLVNSNFPDFTCNTIIEIQSEKIGDEKNLEYLLEAIKLIGEDSSKDEYSNMHNITIDHFSDKILIQFHVDMDPEMSLENAHEIVSKLENQIESKVDEIFGENKFSEVISHIEPREPLRKIHSHSIVRTPQEEIINEIKRIVLKINKIQGIHDIKIQQEPDGIYLTIILLISSETKIKEVHHLTEQASNALFSSIKNLKRCHIHAEPSFSTK